VLSLSGLQSLGLTFDFAIAQVEEAIEPIENILVVRDGDYGGVLLDGELAQNP
jgi:hypothetical protein